MDGGRDGAPPGRRRHARSTSRFRLCCRRWRATPSARARCSTNLVDNAIKYSPHGGRIELGVEAGDGYARFTVRDEGLGIPLGEQKRIFEKFYRLDPDHRRGIGGSGLGLYISRELVRTMNGRIWVESDPGKGATFTFELPLAERVTVPA